MILAALLVVTFLLGMLAGGIVLARVAFVHCPQHTWDSVIETVERARTRVRGSRRPIETLGTYTQVQAPPPAPRAGRSVPHPPTSR